MRKGKYAAVALVITAIAGTGAAPAQAWEYAGKSTARTIWSGLDWAPAPDPDCEYITPRKGIRISDVRAKGYRWAAVNLASTGCAEGPILLKSRKGSKRWGVVTGYIDFGRPGTCIYMKKVPPRVVIDLTGMTCRGGRDTPKKLRNDPWL